MASHRSTKGASKARRDHINHEIRNMRALLPVRSEEQEGLSYLHSMAAICTYIRKSVLLQGTAAAETTQCPLPYEAFLQALHGFILVTTSHGRLVYVSENVTDYLGLSMIDVLQGDTVYDMIERQDVDMVRSNLDINNNSPSERSFVCCMQTSKAFKQQQGSCCSVLVRGTFHSFPQPCPSTSAASSVPGLLFVALCTPTVDRLRSSEQHLCHSFSSAHQLDMTFAHLSESVVNYLGYSAAEITGQSWYSLIHPEDVSSGAESHRSLLNTDKGSEVEMLLRLLCKDQSWTWLYIRANKELQGISCINYLISETEARFLQNKIGSDACRPPSLAHSCNFPAQQTPHTQTYNNNKCFKRQRTSESQSQEPRTRARRDSEQDVHYVSCVYSQSEGSPVCGGESLALFTPPYSPTSSSGSPLQEEELSQDPLMDVHGYRDQLPSSPEASPSYYSYPESGLTCHQTNPFSHSEAPGHSFVQESFIALSTHPSITLSPPTYDFQSYTPDARLVPDSQSASDVCEGPLDCALHQDEFSLLVQPEGGSVTQVHQVPHHVLPVHSSLLTPNQSPTSTETQPYSEREQEEISILAQQISSLARSFDMYQSQSSGHTVPSDSDWDPHPAPKCDLVLDDNVFESIMKDLEMGVSKSSSSSISISSGPRYNVAQENLCFSVNTSQQSGLDTQQFEAVESFSLQVGLYDQNSGLHQLNHYM
ncbi:neuronal PAS domain-containing protein 4-like [Cynoglossus semilaevis]|uniref:Neuronal PAS domain-containing protein 4-like n=1 Tax=Cynoglossus semilaevis TaxID=244447 RepID=A0A3P8WA12_CYNSE|nr:neuronal PAS domain-containing protein 4-like [Cynoglossus semilaevis]